LLHDGVVHGATGGLALRAVEADAGLEVELDVEALVGGVEAGRGNEPPGCPPRIKRTPTDSTFAALVTRRLTRLPCHRPPGSWKRPAPSPMPRGSSRLLIRRKSI